MAEPRRNLLIFDYIFNSVFLSIFHYCYMIIFTEVPVNHFGDCVVITIILLNLLKCVLIFYLVYYIILCFCFTAFRIQMLDGFAPFDFKTKPSWFNPHYLGLIISMEVAYVISGLLFALLVEEWVWDYAITVTVIHITVTSAVMAEFPLMLHWWAALGSGLILMICSGQCLAFYLFKDNFIYPVLDDF